MRAHTNFQRILLSAKRCLEAELRLGTASAAVWDLCSPYFFALGSGAAWDEHRAVWWLDELPFGVERHPEPDRRLEVVTFESSIL